MVFFVKGLWIYFLTADSAYPAACSGGRNRAEFFSFLPETKVWVQSAFFAAQESRNGTSERQGAI
jgi:hypothetical protein